MKLIFAILAIALTTACQTPLKVGISHTLKDGTVIRTDGQTLSVTSGKNVIDLTLPTK